MPATTRREMREKLEKILSDKEAMTKSANGTFKQFDVDRDGFLSLQETAAMLQRLCTNLQLPPVDDATLRKLFAQYDAGDTKLSPEEFARMYRHLILRIRDKYYPSRKIRVRREFFVGRTKLNRGESIRDVYTFEKKLGAGSFGEVYLVVETKGKLRRVCKIINKDRAAAPVEQIESEISILKTLDHPNILKIFEVYEDYNSIYIIMEECSGGELMSRIRKTETMAENSVAVFVSQILRALVYCHSRKIVHKDLKLENVMFADSSPTSPLKVIDFGLSEIFASRDARSSTAAGTVLYMAPEVFGRCLGLRCDVWSVGVMTYMMLTGKLPFPGRTLNEVRSLVCGSRPPIERDGKHLSPQAKDLLRYLLTKDPTLRPSAKEALSHKWFELAPLIREQLCASVQENLKVFMKQKPLIQILENLLAHHLTVSGPQIQRIRNLFRQIDADGDGRLSAAELSQALASAGWPMWDINRVLGALDIADTGSVDYTEFVAACYNWRDTELNQLWSAFQRVDKDGDGELSIDDFRAVLLQQDSKLVLGVNKSTDDKELELERMIQQLDNNNNGKVGWHEFLRFIRAGRLDSKVSSTFTDSSPTISPKSPTIVTASAVNPQSPSPKPIQRASPAMTPMAASPPVMAAQIPSFPAGRWQPFGAGGLFEGFASPLHRQPFQNFMSPRTTRTTTVVKDQRGGRVTRTTTTTHYGPHGAQPRSRSQPRTTIQAVSPLIGLGARQRSRSRPTPRGTKSDEGSLVLTKLGLEVEQRTARGGAKRRVVPASCQFEADAPDIDDIDEDSEEEFDDEEITDSRPWAL